MYTPVNPSFTIYKWGLRVSKLYRYVLVMEGAFTRVLDSILLFFFFWIFFVLFFMKLRFVADDHTKRQGLFPRQTTSV